MTAQFLREKIEEIFKDTDPNLNFSVTMSDGKTKELSGADMVFFSGVIAWQIAGKLDPHIVLKSEHDEKVKIKEESLRVALKEARDKARYHSRDLGTLGYSLQTDKVHEIIDELGRSLFKQAS